MAIERDRTWIVALPVVVAIAVFAVAWPTARAELGFSAATALAAGLAAAAPVGLAGVAPIAAWMLSALGAAAVATAGATSPTGLGMPVVHVVALLGLLLVVGVRAPLWAVAAAGVVTAIVLGIDVAPPSLYPLILIGIVMVLIVAILGRQVRGSRQALARSEELAAHERARAAVLVERARIARDLHDVVAHSMSMVAVRAETARYRVPDVSEPVADELSAIAAAARAALSDVRGVLGVLRSDEDTVDHRPQPGPDDVDALLDETARAGVELSVARSGDPTAAGGAATLSLHRILQEALTNAVRHAGGAAIGVHVDHGDDAVHLRVVNGPGAAVTGPGSGLGITGMRERAAAVGGTLDARPAPDGGFVVEAVLPTARQLDRGDCAS